MLEHGGLAEITELRGCAGVGYLDLGRRMVHSSLSNQNACAIVIPPFLTFQNEFCFLLAGWMDGIPTTDGSYTTEVPTQLAQTRGIRSLLKKYIPQYLTFSLAVYLKKKRKPFPAVSMSVVERLTQSLKVADLKRLSSLLGLNITGNKTDLRNQIHSLADNATTPPTPISRILSIDMGIRNLAYCVVDVPAAADRRERPPKILHWTRTQVPLFPTLTSPSISLPHFAAAANTLATTLLRDHAPSHILIERQRWRSGGASSVLEWTIRVNSLEAMLHATLYALQTSGAWAGSFESVDPGRVTRLWVPEKKGRVTAAGIKMLKKEVVRGWLRSGGVMRLAGKDAEESAELVLLWDAARGAKKRNGEKLTPEERKVDDLADCLLQALAWMGWQENRMRLLSGKLPLEIAEGEDNNNKKKKITEGEDNNNKKKKKITEGEDKKKTKRKKVDCATCKLEGLQNEDVQGPK
ncbi:Ydc2-catalyt-domain-containing protein [Wilcoxina mikolae CBS 423.85]|nr:Ydc2-catalyt-domain-containing protein [Wilcoxina mikolae CBS 423.85]